MNETPEAQDTFRRFLGRSLPRFFGPLSPELRAEIAGFFEPTRVANGESLYTLGDPGDSMHIVVTGRLSVRVPDGNGGLREVRHLTTGDPLGEIALLTEQPRTAEVVAIRDTTLGKLTKASFDAFVEAHPNAALDMARFTIRMLTSSEVAAATAPAKRNLVLLPLDPDLPIADLGRRLEVALLRFGSTRYFDRATVARLLGLSTTDPEALDPDADSLGHLLAAAENERRFVLYQADPTLTPWTRKCLSQADRVLLVADSASTPGLREIEERIGGGDLPLLTEQDLLLVHKEVGKPPSGTSAWLAPRHVSRHYHVPWHDDSGVHRVARMLADRAVTLVLGAGGARGFAHVGAVRALREAGVPIDAVGGSSIGSLIGSVVALGWSDEEILFRCKQAFVDEEPMNDYTFPMFALLKGRKLSRALQRHLGETLDVVDTWLPFFCVSANLSQSSAATHRSGTLWKALQASISLPAILPPFVKDGHLHVDGATLNTMPVDVMRDWVPGSVIAVDPSVHREYSLRRDEAPTPLGYLAEQIFPGRRRGGFPGMSSLILKSTILGGSSSLSKTLDQIDLYLNPPMGQYSLLDWSRFYDVVDTGYRYTRDVLVDWLQEHPEVVHRDPRRGLPPQRDAV